MGNAFQRGRLLYSQKRYAMAAEEFAKELAENPNSGAAMSMRALSLTHDGKVEEGIALAKAAVGANPEMAFAHYALACAFAGPPPRWQPINLLYLVSATARRIAYRRRVRKAKAPAMEAIRLEPTNADFIALIAAIELDLRRPKKALEWADRGLAARADHVRCANLRARALAKMGQGGAARATLQSSLAIDPENASTHAAGGWTNLQTGDAQTAEEHFRESLRLDPNNARVHRGLQAARQHRLRRRAPYIAGMTGLVATFVADKYWPEWISSPTKVLILLGIGCGCGVLTSILFRIHWWGRKNRP